LGGERLEIYLMGAADGPKFAQAVEEMTQRARKLGPNPLHKKHESEIPEVQTR